MPPPDYYEVAGKLIDKNRKSGLSKGPRITIAHEIEKTARRNSLPGPGAYDQNFKPRIIGAFNLKDQKTTFIEDA